MTIFTVPSRLETVEEFVLVRHLDKIRTANNSRSNPWVLHEDIFPLLLRCCDRGLPVLNEWGILGQERGKHGHDETSDKTRSYRCPLAPQLSPRSAKPEIRPSVLSSDS